MSRLENIEQANEGSATQRAYLTLRELIVTGDLKPGEKLKIDALRQRLNVGASPIREALSLLTSDNLVERLDQRGFRAAPVSAENFKEILILRCELEDLALRQSIANATQIWEENAVLAHHRMNRIKPNSLEDFEKRHKHFHMALLANSPSPILLKICSQLYDLNIRYRYLAVGATDYKHRDVEDEHNGILDAAIRKDADLASERLLSHYQRTGAFLTEILNNAAVKP